MRPGRHRHIRHVRRVHSRRRRRVLGVRDRHRLLDLPTDRNLIMREIFKPQPAGPGDPGRVFYTITADDVGKRVIKTTIGPLDIGSVIGAVLPIDVGKRLYRVPCNDRSAPWIWQCESDTQRDARLAKAELLHNELTAIRETTQAGALHPEGE
jgi:hypothetical protein